MSQLFVVRPEGEVILDWSFMGASSQEAKLQTSFTTVQVGPDAAGSCCCWGLLCHSCLLMDLKGRGPSFSWGHAVSRTADAY